MGSDDERIYRVFISSTYLDNKDRRKAVADAILGARMQPEGMEWWTADARPAVEVCLARVAECDVFVGIVAHRYGWEPPGKEKSITWLEYEAAGAKKLQPAISRRSLRRSRCWRPRAPGCRPCLGTPLGSP